MSKYQQAMSKKPAHVAIVYNRGEKREHDQYRLVVHGTIPIQQLIGFVVRVQAELAFRNPDPCEADKCVIVYDGGKLSWFVDSTIPVDALVGALEILKCQLVDSQMSAMVQEAQKRANTGLVSADGKPILKELQSGI